MCSAQHRENNLYFEAVFCLFWWSIFYILTLYFLHFDGAFSVCWWCIISVCDRPNSVPSWSLVLHSNPLVDFVWITNHPNYESSHQVAVQPYTLAAPPVTQIVEHASPGGFGTWWQMQLYMHQQNLVVNHFKKLTSLLVISGVPLPQITQSNTPGSAMWGMCDFSLPVVGWVCPMLQCLVRSRASDYCWFFPSSRDNGCAVTILWDFDPFYYC